MAGRITVIYICLALANVAPQVEALNRYSASDWEAYLASMFLMCGPYLNFKSICTPKTRISVFGVITLLLMRIFTVISNFLGVRVRWISSYLSGAKLAPWVRAYYVHTSCTLLNVSHVSAVDFSYARIFTSSTNFTGEAFTSSFSHPSTSSALKNRNRIGDTGEPYKIPAETGRNALVLPSNDSVDCLFFKKLLTHLTRRMGIFRMRKLCVSLSCDTWSKAPATFKFSINAICSVFVFYIVCTCSTRSSSAVSVKRPRLAPIWHAGNRWFASVTSVNFLATTDFRAFPIVFNSAINLYAFGSV